MHLSRLLIIILIAIIMRMGVSFYLGDKVPPAKDETSYSLLASRLADGYGFSFDEQSYPGFVLADTPTAHWSFLYTAFTAGIYSLFGYHPILVRLISALLSGILMPWMMYRLACRVWPKQKSVAFMAAGLGGVYAYFVLYGAMIQTEALFIITVLWSLERSLALEDSLSNSEMKVTQILIVAIGLGLALGVATLLRQSILPWIVFLFAWLLWTGWRSTKIRESMASLLIAGLILMACILPLTIRNYLVYGDFLLLNSNAGFAMYSAQHPLHGTRFQAFKAAPLPADLEPVPQNEAQWDQVLMKRGFQFILENPQRYIALSLSRTADYFMFWPAQETSLINNIGRILSFGLFLPAMIYGLWLSRGDCKSCRLLYAFMIFYSLLHILTWAMIRYRLPVDAVLLLFAALALDRLLRFVPKDLWRWWFTDETADQVSATK